MFGDQKCKQISKKHLFWNVKFVILNSQDKARGTEDGKLTWLRDNKKKTHTHVRARACAYKMVILKKIEKEILDWNFKLYIFYLLTGLCGLVGVSMYGTTIIEAARNDVGAVHWAFPVTAASVTGVMFCGILMAISNPIHSVSSTWNSFFSCVFF